MLLKQALSELGAPAEVMHFAEVGDLNNLSLWLFTEAKPKDIEIGRLEQRVKYIERELDGALRKHSATQAVLCELLDSGAETPYVPLVQRTLETMRRTTADFDWRTAPNRSGIDVLNEHQCASLAAQLRDLDEPALNLLRLGREELLTELVAKEGY